MPAIRPLQKTRQRDVIVVSDSEDGSKKEIIDLTTDVVTPPPSKTICLKKLQARLLAEKKVLSSVF
jgi:hypothetical protein